MTALTPVSQSRDRSWHIARHEHTVGLPRVTVRPVVRGKFLYVEGVKFFVRGVTYGPFRPTADGCEYKDPVSVRHDFALMAEQGINTVRVYTVPPRWLLDCAAECGLRVFIGLPWEQHITFLDRRATRQSIKQRVIEGVRQCADHPAVLAYAIGNEIPAPIVRWYGKRRVERFLKQLYLAAKRTDRQALVTYVNFPTTEYLSLPFLDFDCFNVYLEEPEKLSAYLLRLHNLSHDRPLVMGEVGLDSRRNGQDKQAEVLDWQIRTVFECGCAGMFVFAWTDEWHRGGFDIDDWDFGLTTRDRQSKPALDIVAAAYAHTPFRDDRPWPRISVVVCTYNGSRTIRETLDALAELDYPDYEVIVVNDGSQDQTGTILFHTQHELGERMTLRVIEIENGGLSNARNIGMHEATGQIVSYIDDDAYPDPHWLRYIAHSFMTTDFVGVGGPNLHVPEDNDVAHCVSHSPGGPNHVLMTDTEAEHIPGCNCSFRRSALLAVGGFDTQFRIAGDDVDLCWRLQERDGVIGFHPGAMVWHHRRHTFRGYLRQQKNYGRAEAMLERKWPQKYNGMGHVSWAGRIYGTGVTLPLILRRWRVYHGVWGMEPFQGLYTANAGKLRSLPLMPEWYLLAVAVMLITLPGILWKPLLFLVPLAILVLGAPLVQALASAWSTEVRGVRPKWRRIRHRAIVAAMHVLQPIVRLQGRLLEGLTPWRRPRVSLLRAIPAARSLSIWTEHWASSDQRLMQLETSLHRIGANPVRGGEYDRWDLEVRGGICGAVRVLMTIEEHGAGRQLVRLRSWPKVSSLGMIAIVGLAAFGGLSLGVGELGAGIMLLTVSVSLLVRSVGDCMSATAAYVEAVSPSEV